MSIFVPVNRKSVFFRRYRTMILTLKMRLG